MGAKAEVITGLLVVGVGLAVVYFGRKKAAEESSSNNSGVLTVSNPVGSSLAGGTTGVGGFANAIADLFTARAGEDVTDQLANLDKSLRGEITQQVAKAIPKTTTAKTPYVDPTNKYLASIGKPTLDFLNSPEIQFPFG